VETTRTGTGTRYKRRTDTSDHHSAVHSRLWAQVGSRTSAASIGLSTRPVDVVPLLSCRVLPSASHLAPRPPLSLSPVSSSVRPCDPVSQSTSYQMREMSNFMNKCLSTTRKHRTKAYPHPPLPYLILTPLFSPPPPPSTLAHPSPLSLHCANSLHASFAERNASSIALSFSEPASLSLTKTSTSKRSSPMYLLSILTM
jgi:hypothetical protein